METDKKCSNCKWWKPTYAGIGACYREGQMHAKFWIEGKDSRLLTVSSFYCSEHEDIPPTSEMEAL